MSPAGRRGALVAALALAGCGPDVPADGPDAPPVDSAFVDALADVHLAEARAALAGHPAASLRGAALARHGLDSAAFGRRQAGLSGDPEALRATYDALDRALAAERAGP